LALLGGALVLACSADNDAGSLFTGSGPSTLGDGDNGGQDTGDAGNGHDDDDDGGDGDPDSGNEGGGIKLDTLPPDTDGDDGLADEGCSYVDILFIIDNSASMTPYQQALTAAFPTFVEAMFATLPPNTDLHVGVTTSSFSSGGSHGENNCVAAESLATIQQYYTPPDQGMVAGNGYQGRLVEYDNKRYFAADTGNPADLAALTQWFSNAAAVGSSGGSFEFNAAAAGHAFNPANAGFNDGFLRDEGAVLMLFILSDEADQSFDVEDPDDLHDLVVDAKAGCGGEACIVTGGLLSSWCTGDQNASYKFLAGFGQEPVLGVINGGPFNPPPDYTQVVGDALAQVIGETCETIPPVG
jgi:hypothetical protein